MLLHLFPVFINIFNKNFIKEEIVNYEKIYLLTFYTSNVC